MVAKRSRTGRTGWFSQVWIGRRAIARTLNLAALNRTRPAFAGALVLIVPVALVALVAGNFLGSAEQRIAIIFLINLIAVVANGLYSGNSGIMSFGHLGFMGVGAYLSAILTMTPAKKARL
mgnify:FL=1